MFGHGEGLPGRAWEARAPILLKNLREWYFLRGEAAAKAGLTCALALPRGSAMLNRCAETGLPQVTDAMAFEVSVAGVSAHAAGYVEALAMPVVEAGRLKAVVAFYF